MQELPFLDIEHRIHKEPYGFPKKPWVHYPKMFHLHRKVDSFQKILIVSKKIVYEETTRKIHILIHKSYIGIEIVFYFHGCVSDEHGRVPPLLPQRGREPLFHRLASPGVPESAVGCTYPPRLRWGCSAQILSATTPLDAECYRPDR
jgi:hypothetical protein